MTGDKHYISIISKNYLFVLCVCGFGFLVFLRQGFYVLAGFDTLILLPQGYTPRPALLSF